RTSAAGHGQHPSSEHARRGPQLGPVGKPFVLLEFLFVDQVLGAGGVKNHERPIADLHARFHDAKPSRERRLERFGIAWTTQTPSAVDDRARSPSSSA